MVWAAMAMAGLVGSVALFAFLGSERDRRAVASATTDLEVDDHQVRRVLADGRVEAVGWDEILEVEVITRAVRGAGDDGVLVVLGVDDTRGCLIPSALAAERGVIERLPRLPGFDTRALVAAMEQAPPSRTTCWRRPSSSDGASR